MFGVFNHSIPLNLEDRITIIHGPNGYGKTTLLQMVQNLLGRHFNRLRRVPFDRFSLAMKDGREVVVTKRPGAKGDAESGEPAVALHFELKSPANNNPDFTLDFPAAREGIGFPLEIIDQYIGGLERVGAQSWIQVQTGRLLDLDDVIEIYGDDLPLTTGKRTKLPEWLMKWSEELDVRLIESQRLLSLPVGRRSRRPDTPLGFEPAVSAYSKELAASIQEIQAKYGTFSQQLDSTFPSRVIQKGPAASADADALRKRLQDLEGRRGRIIAAGLLTKEQYSAPLFDPPKAVDDTTKSILSLYSEDVEQKLSVFDEITAKVELFKEIVNKRLSYKELDVQSQSGFGLRTSAGLPLSPTDLSSGEQHELVLLYELLFKTMPNALVLIDEPELSLHVAWQVEFLKDLTRVVKLAAFDVILATHSPQIINDRWDLAVELKGPQA